MSRSGWKYITNKFSPVPIGSAQHCTHECLNIKTVLGSSSGFHSKENWIGQSREIKMEEAEFCAWQYWNWNGKERYKKKLERGWQKGIELGISFTFYTDCALYPQYWTKFGVSGIDSSFICSVVKQAGTFKDTTCRLWCSADRGKPNEYQQQTLCQLKSKIRCDRFAVYADK